MKRAEQKQQQNRRQVRDYYVYCHKSRQKYAGLVFNHFQVAREKNAKASKSQRIMEHME